MKVHLRGKPNFDNLVKWEREALIHPLLDVIKDFYKCETNRQAFEKWKLDKKATGEDNEIIKASSKGKTPL